MKRKWANAIGRPVVVWVVILGSLVCLDRAELGLRHRAHSLAKGLSATDDGTRLAALNGLADMVVGGAGLRILLSDDDLKAMRQSAQDALASGDARWQLAGLRAGRLFAASELPGSAEATASLVRSRNAEVRAQAVMLMPCRQGPGVEPILREGLRDDDPVARVACAYCLSELKLSAADPASVVQDLPACRNIERDWAFAALVAAGDEGVGLLVSTLGTLDKKARVPVANVLKKAGPRAVPALVAALRGAEPNAASASADILREMGDPAYVAVAPLLADQSSATRDRAARVLDGAKRLPAEARRIIEGLAGSSDGATRTQAVAVLEKVDARQRKSLPGAPQRVGP
jgi:HEAT repeat protein